MAGLVLRPGPSVGYMVLGRGVVGDGGLDVECVVGG